MQIITISNREQQPFVYFSTRIRPKAGADSGFDTNWSTTAVVTFTASDHPAFPTPAVRPALLASPKAPVPSTHLTIRKTIRTILTASIASPGILSLSVPSEIFQPRRSRPKIPQDTINTTWG